MLKRFIFHYDPDYPDSVEPIEENGISPNDILIAHDGLECNVYIEGYKNSDDSVVAYFDDGNECSVYMRELEEIWQ